MHEMHLTNSKYEKKAKTDSNNEHFKSRIEGERYVFPFL